MKRSRARANLSACRKPRNCARKVRLFPRVVCRYLKQRKQTHTRGTEIRLKCATRAKSAGRVKLTKLTEQNICYSYITSPPQSHARATRATRLSVNPSAIPVFATVAGLSRLPLMGLRTFRVGERTVVGWMDVWGFEPWLKAFAIWN